MKNPAKHFLLLVSSLLVLSCATFDKIQPANIIAENVLPGTNIYLVGDAGYLENDNASETLNALNERYSGKSAYYQNTDLRLNLFKFNAGLVPAKFGIFSGFDYGRVWLNNDNSNKWHSSTGGEIYANGAGLFTLRASYFSSDDGGRFMFGLGFGF